MHKTQDTAYIRPHILPQFVVKAFELGVGVLDVLLGLLPHVEDGTIPARAQDILRATAVSIDRIAH